jgi:16S rRNA C967 or C1407 C5-methylase (RsmB/RsmF family)
LLHPDGTGLALLRGEYPESRELDWLTKFLKPGMTVMDVGANQGIYTTAAARAVGRSGRVYAFEPAPSELKKLRANIKINRLRNVAVIESAVGRAAERRILRAEKTFRLYEHLHD